ncbi:hypothetical protein R6H00_05235, partial [Actinotignum timonense]|nr:hypothetical protein [Actinotignum timonense]
MAPAMHTQMWEHPATQENIAVLQARLGAGALLGAGTLALLCEAICGAFLALAAVVDARVQLLPDPLLAAMPLFGMLLGSFFGGNPVTFLFGTLIGRCCLALALICEVVGILWMRRLVRKAEQWG